MMGERGRVRGRCAIKHRPHVSKALATGALLIMILLAACGGSGGDRRATPIPTRIPPTPTLRSTALPDAPEAPAIGTSERPITIWLALPEERVTSEARQLAHELERQLNDETGLTFTVTFTDENTALAELCSGAPSLAWTSAFTYAAAHRQCEVEPLLAARRGRAPTFQIGQTSEIVGRADITAPAQLAGQTFCRSAQQDTTAAWVIPALLMGSQGVNPFIDLDAVRDYEDDQALVRALYGGECSAAGLRAGDFEKALLAAAQAAQTAKEPHPTYDELTEALHVIAPAGDTTAPTNPSQWTVPAGVIPYEVLVTAPESALPEPPRESAEAAITAFFTDRIDGTTRTKRLLAADSVFAVEAQHYRSFLAMLSDAGWDMAFTR